MMVGSVEGVEVPRHKYQAHNVEALRRRLREAESVAKPAGYNTRQVVRELGDELRTMLRDKNYTVAGLAKFLAENGVQIGYRTLGQYLRDEGVTDRRSHEETQRQGQGDKHACSRRPPRWAWVPGRLQASRRARHRPATIPRCRSRALARGNAGWHRLWTGLTVDRRTPCRRNEGRVGEDALCGCARRLLSCPWQTGHRNRDRHDAT